MMKISIYITIVFLIVIKISFAQQTPLLRQYNANGYLLNPSCAGDGEYAKAMLHYRKQWMDINGSPETTIFSIDSKVKDKKVGIGFTFINDITNIIGRTSAFGTYSYKLKINKDNKISFGLSVGFLQNKIYFDRIRAVNIYEESILDNTENSTAFNAGFGLNYKYKNFYLGAVTSQLFSNKLDYLNQADFKTLDYQLIRDFYSDLKYNYKINDTYSIVPGVVMRTVQGMPVQMDFIVTGKFDDKHWANIAYSPQYGASIGLGGIVYDNFLVAYNYDFTTGSMYSYSGSTHEITLGYVFNSKSKVPKEYKAIKVGYNEYEKINQQQSEQIDEVVQENEDLSNVITEKDKIISEQNKEIERLKSEHEKYKNVILSDVGNQKFGINDINNSKGTNKDDIKLGYYVIVGSFVNFNNAKSYQKILLDRFEIETKMFQNKNSKYYFVYTLQTKEKSALKKEYKSLKKLEIEKVIDSNIWFYKLENKDEIIN